MKKLNILIPSLFILVFLSSCQKSGVIDTLIITGQSEHNWQASSPVLKQILDGSELFSCDIVVTPGKGEDMSSFSPDFSKYKLVVLDYSGDRWPEKAGNDFVDFVRNGGGVVVYHGASISFPDWKEYNEIIGLGGWNNRNEKNGPYVYYSRNRLLTDTTAGPAGSHGERHDFEVRTRITDHPITAGLPARWMHASDELYQQLRGPAQNMQVLATAFADPKFEGTGRDEPVLMVIKYGNGRVFHTALGHADEGGGPAMQCSGFLVTLLRGAEWAATGTVTQEVPFDFPTAAGVFVRPGFEELTLKTALEGIASYDIAKSTRYLSFLQEKIRKAAGNEEELLKLEKAMIKLIGSNETSVGAKKVLLHELSWMGSDLSVKSITALKDIPELKDEVDFALERLQN